jgi:hypothetical protein
MEIPGICAADGEEIVPHPESKNAIIVPDLMRGGKTVFIDIPISLCFNEFLSSA